MVMVTKVYKFNVKLMVEELEWNPNVQTLDETCVFNNQQDLHPIGMQVVAREFYQVGIHPWTLLVSML
jgi:hypothetical protein